MRATSAFFAGIGTVVVAIGAGLGGGLLLGDIMSPQQPKYQSNEVTRLEQRGSQAPILASKDASQPVPYLASSQIGAAIAESATQPPKANAQPQPQQVAAQPADTKPPADTNKTPPANTQPVAAAEPTAKERASPEDSLAKARDADVRREARRADDRRRAERRQQWAEKR